LLPLRPRRGTSKRSESGRQLARRRGGPVTAQFDHHQPGLGEGPADYEQQSGHGQPAEDDGGAERIGETADEQQPEQPAGHEDGDYDGCAAQ
jgi:hypothetical protein